MGAVFRWVKYIYEWCKDFGTKILGSGVGEIDSLVGLGKGVNFYVDGDNGSDANDGKSWARAFATIQKAITTSNALMDWTYKKMNTIWVMPGVYPENLDGDILAVHIVGLGLAGSDTAVEIHPTTGSVLSKVLAASCNLVGAHLVNLRFEVDEAVPILDIEVLNNSLIESCYFTNGANVAAWGLDTDNSGGLTLRNCVFESGQLTGLTHGLWFRGFCSFAQIYDNVIAASTRGILIAGTSSGTVIRHNTINPHKPNTDALAEGIEDANGASMVVDNNIMATVVINHAGVAGQLIRNRDSITPAWVN